MKNIKFVCMYGCNMSEWKEIPTLNYNEYDYTRPEDFDTVKVKSNIPEEFINEIDIAAKNILNIFQTIDTLETMITPIIRNETGNIVSIGIGSGERDENNEMKTKYKITIERTK